MTTTNHVEINLDADDHDSLGYGPAYGDNGVSLILDPEARRIDTFATIGSGQPCSTYHGRAIVIGIAKRETVASSLESWLEDRADTLSEICGGYLGTLVDVHGNRCGRWTDEAERLASDLSDDLDQAYTSQSIATFWDAADWFQCDGDASIADAVLDAGDLETYCDQEHDHALAQNYYLELADLRDYVAMAIEDHADNCEDDYPERARALRSMLV